VSTASSAELLTQPVRDYAALLDVRAVAQLLGCSARHVYRLSDSGAMPAPVRLGALVRWRRSELDAWVAGGCRPCRQGIGR
jgi:excisionase family DNA binding protein